MILDLCCLNMKEAIYEDKTVNYNNIYRYYFLKTVKSSEVILYICPWCLKALPDKLIDVWFEVLEAEYDIKLPDTTNYSNVPNEFLSDEWWKKRGL